MRINAELLALEHSAHQQDVAAERALGEGRPRMHLPLGAVYNLLSVDAAGKGLHEYRRQRQNSGTLRSEDVAA